MPPRPPLAHPPCIAKDCHVFYGTVVDIVAILPRLITNFLVKQFFQVIV